MEDEKQGHCVHYSSEPGSAPEEQSHQRVGEPLNKKCERTATHEENDERSNKAEVTAMSIVPMKPAPLAQPAQNPPPPVHSNFIVQYFKKKSQSWSKNQFITIVILSFVEFFASTVISIQAPFYPDVARQKGATATEYGLVFAIFELTVFIISPVYGSKMSELGPTRVFNWGILVTGVCCIVFGLLNAIEGRAAFIWTSAIVRVVEAMGDAAFETASFTIIAIEFPDSVATNFAILEIFYGLGLIIGPTLGGALYELGGFELPFLSMGGLLFLSAIATYIFLPESGPRKKPANNANSSVQKSEPGRAPDEPTAAVADTTPAPVVVHGGFTMFKMLRIPVIAMVAYSIVAATIGVGFLSANLDLHLAQFQLNKVAVGTVFILNGGVYAVTAPAWGWLCDHTNKQKMIPLAGAVFTILGFIFIGPVPYFPSDTTLPISCVGLVLFGIGFAATMVSAFILLLKDAIAHGYPDDISTYGLVSGLWTSMAALGYFVGPFIGGVLDDWVGFRWASVFVIGGQVVLIIFLGGYYASNFMRKRSSMDVTTSGEDSAEHEMRMEEDKKNHNDISKTLNPIFVSSTNANSDQANGCIQTVNNPV